jgi:hypothetical protein
MSASAKTTASLSIGAALFERICVETSHQDLFKQLGQKHGEKEARSALELFSGVIGGASNLIELQPYESLTVQVGTSHCMVDFGEILSATASIWDGKDGVKKERRLGVYIAFAPNKPDLRIYGEDKKMIGEFRAEDVVRFLYLFCRKGKSVREAIETCLDCKACDPPKLTTAAG